jgi:predicted SprT family Zn-dependent metalloprotease
MELFDAEILAKQLMSKYIPEYKFAWSREKRTYGRCDYRNKTIILSAPLTPLCPEEDVRNTILHEIAHALTPKAKHGKAWKIQMLKFGLSPDRCMEDSHIDRSQLNGWRATCKGCAKVHEMIRKPRLERSCGACSKGQFNPDFLLTYVKI